jgi:predicted transcriptional regulator
MAEETARRVALLSIHPRHAESILAGRKLVELRRMPVAADTTHVIVYATAPVKLVIGWFEVAGIDEASRTAIWNAHQRVCGVSRREFRAYFDGADRAFAIRIAQAHRLRSPLPLESLPGVRRPPQSFQYLDAESVGWVLGAPTTPERALLHA